MKLENLISETYEVLAKGELDQAIKLLDTYALEKKINSKEIIEDIIHLRRQQNTIRNAKLAKTLAYDQIALLEAQLTEAITVFMSKLQNYENNITVRTESNGHGMLMHNIPQCMPMGLPTRCTIRIGAIQEKLLKGMEKEVFVKLERIKVARLMEVQLLPEEQDVFEIRTINRFEQEVDFDNYAQWRYDITPLKLGQFNLSLKIATVKYIDGKDRFAEEVYDIEVSVETTNVFLNNRTNDILNNWRGVSIVNNTSNEVIKCTNPKCHTQISIPDGASYVVCPVCNTWHFPTRFDSAAKNLSKGNKNDEFPSKINPLPTPNPTEGNPLPQYGAYDGVGMPTTEPTFQQTTAKKEEKSNIGIIVLPNGLILDLKVGINIIGRNNLPNGEPTVSRRHCVIEVIPNSDRKSWEYLLYDIGAIDGKGSLNKVYVFGRTLPLGISEKIIISHGTVFFIGNVKLTLLCHR